MGNLFELTDWGQSICDYHKCKGKSWNTLYQGKRCAIACRERPLYSIEKGNRLVRSPIYEWASEFILPSKFRFTLVCNEAFPQKCFLVHRLETEGIYCFGWDNRSHSSFREMLFTLYHMPFSDVEETKKLAACRTDHPIACRLGRLAYWCRLNIPSKTK